MAVPYRTDDAPRPLWRLLTREDVRDHPVQVIFIVLVLLATLVLPPVVAGVTSLRRVRATEEVSGTVVHVSKNRGRRSTTWVYTYDYRFDGSSYRGAFKLFSSRSSGLRDESGLPARSNPEVGAPVALFVDPLAPHRSYVSRDLVRGAFALLSFFWGVAALLICLREVPSGGYLLRPRYAWAFALVFTALPLPVLPLSIPPGRWWLIPLVYLAVLAVTTLWLLVTWKRSVGREPGTGRGRRDPRGR